MNRVPAFAILLTCLALGVAGGLVFAWFIVPVEPSQLTPAALNPTDREMYIRLLAAAFAADNDRPGASRRLAGLGPAAEDELLDLIMADLRAGQTSQSAGQLIDLATALGLDAPAVALLAPPRPLPQATAGASAGPATPTPPPSDDPTFILIGSEQICVQQTDVGLIEITIEDSVGQPLPGTAVTAAWPGGHNRFFTGFQSDQSGGFADFRMEPETPYSIAIGDDPPSATGLQTHLCPDGRVGGWRLAYRGTSP